MDATISSLLSELTANLKQIYSKNYKKTVLYGSCAREEAGQYSDVDVLVILQKIESMSHERGKASDILSQLSLKYDKVISLHPISEESWTHRQAPFLINARKEGVVV
ncbi:MAG: nucleotidyltransferase domain-containing protein [bacterium]